MQKLKFTIRTVCMCLVAGDLLLMEPFTGPLAWIGSIKLLLKIYHVVKEHIGSTVNAFLALPELTNRILKTIFEQTDHLVCITTTLLRLALIPDYPVQKTTITTNQGSHFVLSALNPVIAQLELFSHTQPNLIKANTLMSSPTFSHLRLKQ